MIIFSENVISYSCFFVGGVDLPLCKCVHVWTSCFKPENLSSLFSNCLGSSMQMLNSDMRILYIRCIVVYLVIIYFDIYSVFVDYYLLMTFLFKGNLHKWLYAPRGCALLYVKKEHQGWVKPVVTSHGHKTSFQHDFFCQGTRDETPFCVAPEAIKFYNAIGGYVSLLSNHTRI